MKYRGHQIRRRWLLTILIMICVSLGTLYPLLGRELSDTRAIIVGASIGFVGSLFIYLLEMQVFNPKKRRYSFIPILIVKTISYFIGFFVIIIVVKGFIDSLWWDIPFMEYVTGEDFRNFIYKEDFNIILIYTLAFLSFVNFGIQMTRKIGYDMMINYITGRYHKPIKEKRIFMFIDLKSSTTIAEKIGNLDYYSLLNDIYFDITKCILVTNGEIYRYVGDEINITWPMNKGLKKLNCIKIYFYVLNQIKRQKEKYLTKYGFVPQFTVGLHCGKVTTAEIGEVKSQVIHYGEVIHTSAMIKSEFKRLNKTFLITDRLVEKLNLPSSLNMIKCGQFERSDPSNPIDLYTINEVEA